MPEGLTLTPATRLVAASHNEGKVRELAELFAPYGIEMVSAASLGLPVGGLLVASVLSILPAAHRSVRLDPMTALRCE